MYQATPDPYCYPDTGVLKNMPGIGNQAEFQRFESAITAQRGEEPFPVGRFGVRHYRAIRHHLFQDVYPWAGRLSGDEPRHGPPPAGTPDGTSGAARRFLAFMEGGVAPRANWKGFLQLSEVVCPVALFTAASESERIAFHTLNRATGHRVHRQFVDEETGEPVEAGRQVKGYETGPGDYVVLEPEEIAAAMPASDKTLAIEAFVPCGEIDDVYFDRPYYLAPSSPVAGEAFALLREGMRARKVAAIAKVVLFRRMRTVLIRAHEAGLIATTLNFDYEVRSAEATFADIKGMKIEPEMLDLARHIIKTKAGAFDPRSFHDRYEQALGEVVRAKLEGRAVKAPERPASTKVVDLMAALRESAKAAGARASSADKAKRSSQKSAPAKPASAARSKRAAARKAS
jgi:DNA end-binding protein Ku